MNHLLLRLGRYIATKGNFLKASVLGFGLPVGALMALAFSEFGGGGVLLALVIAPAAGYVWGARDVALLVLATRGPPE